MTNNTNSGYSNGMKFTLEMFWTNPSGEIEPLLKPLTLDFKTVDDARQVFSAVTNHPKIPAHSITLVSEDRSISERWFQIDGIWRRKDM